MAKTDFKKRVGQAVNKLIADKALLDVRYHSLYTPMQINGSWKWMAFSEPDGILAQRMTVAKGDPKKADEHSEVIACVLVQSEESTSDSLLNPWGKSCIPKIPNGVWIDYHEGNQRKRRLLTVAHVLLVTPKPLSTTVATQKNFKKRKSILERVDAATADATLVIVGKNDSRDSLATKIWNKVKHFLA